MTKDPMADSEVFRQVLIEDAKERAGEHPELDTLIEYLADELDPEAQDRVQEHLAGCRSCTQKLLDLEPLVIPDAIPEGVADLQLEAAWRDFQSRAQAPEPVSRSAFFPRWPAALAASLLVAVVGLSAWVNQLQRTTVDLRRQVAELSQPQVNPPIVYLDEVTRSEPSGAVAELPSDQSFVLLIVIPSAPEAYSSFEALLTDSTGDEVWSGEGLELSEEGTLRLRLPRDLLPAGDYQVVIRGVAGDQREKVIESSLRVLYR